MFTTALAPGVAAADTAAVATLYVNNNSSTCSDSGEGTWAAPFCTIQAAANVVSAGQTVQIAAGEYNQEVDITRSGTADAPITFIGTRASPARSTWGTKVESLNSSTGSTINHGFSIVGARHVLIENLEVGDTVSDGISVSGSSDITINGAAVFAGQAGPAGNTSAGVSVSGSSSAVTVERSDISAKGYGVVADSTSVDTTVSTNNFVGSASPAIVADGATNTHIASNSITYASPAIEVLGSATGTTIENNVIHNSTVDVSVSADATGSTTSDYNDFENESALNNQGYYYVWGATKYATSSNNYGQTEFTAATGQGAHDFFYATDSNPAAGFVHYIDSADSSAPGELPVDYYGMARDDDTSVANTGAGTYGYYDRGAIEESSIQPAVGMSTSAGQAPIGGSVTVKMAPLFGWTGTLVYTFDFGDGTVITSSSPTASHSYAAVGSYTGSATVLSSYGVAASGGPFVVDVVTGVDFKPALTVTPTGALTVSADDSASTDPWDAAYSLDFGDGTTDHVSYLTGAVSHTYAKPGTYTVKLTVTDGGGNSATLTSTGTTAGSDFTAYGPTRILDTRNGTGTGGVAKKLSAGTVLKLKVAGNGSIPSTVTAVAVNLTLTDSTGSGYVAAYPDGASTPTTSNLNYGTGQTVPNMAIVPVGSDGYIDLVKQGPGSIDLIADVTGYFTATASSGYSPLTPIRTLDTRTGTGAAKAKVTATTGVKLKVAGVGGVPSGVTAVALNITLTDSTGYGNVVAYPDGTSHPNASNLNYVSGQTVANMAIVPVGSDGYIDLAKQGPGAIDLIADVDGYYSAAGTSVYVPVTPFRYFDSRSSGNAKLPAQSYFLLPLALNGKGALVTNISGIVLNSTVTDTAANGYLSVFPDTGGLDGTSDVPNVSNLNFVKGQTVPNLTFATPGADGYVDFFNGSRSGSIDVIADVFGYFMTS